MKSVLIILASLLVFGCATTTIKSQEIPKASIGSAGSALGQDIINSIDTYFVKNYNCNSWVAKNVENVSVQGELYFKESGQIHSGSVAENWSITYCEKNIKLGLVVASDGASGSLIAITKL